eukprot:CAMPEP_0117424582 /NCGR_PEP_ID=MMETSP0758-20121206/4972_1 /TAXON_ID=63605 /ORGANISM="Percolomonas cosmopolitus, Strain AE-1 (ATCC 50343)" /LENGTH=229 /DNA_ID=CAMNT_0005208447 /DNA_START=923 /DNA_END=1609 /DNA_ORIENTATION=+
MDIEVLERNHKRFWLAEAEIRRSLTDENEDSIFVKTHLGKYLEPGDMVYGYDLEHENLNDLNYDQRRSRGKKKRKKMRDMPDVVLVKKKYEKVKQRKFTVKPLNPYLKRDEEDFNAFLDEIAQDDDMQKYVKMYRNKQFKEEEDGDDTTNALVKEDELLDEDVEAAELAEKQRLLKEKSLLYNAPKEESIDDEEKTLVHEGEEEEEEEEKVEEEVEENKEEVEIDPELE